MRYAKKSGPCVHCHGAAQDSRAVIFCLNHADAENETALYLETGSPPLYLLDPVCQPCFIRARGTARPLSLGAAWARRHAAAEGLSDDADPLD